MERIMTEKHIDQQHPSGWLHPTVYKCAGGLVFLFVISAWALFDRRQDTGLPLGMMSFLLLIAVALPYVLWRQWHYGRQRREDAPGAFGTWVSGQVDVWQSRLKGRDAMIDALLPLAAVAFGLLAIGIIFDVVRFGIVH
jgi:hypothetical protein